jgi:tetratricopeptide (TPR) repeat protein
MKFKVALLVVALVITYTGSRVYRVAATDGSVLDAIRSSIETGAYAEAERAARKAIAERPNVGALHNVLGEIHVLYGRYDEAERAFKQALALTGDDPIAAKVNLGRLYAMLGRRNEANNLFKEILRQTGSSGRPVTSDLYYYVGVAYQELALFHDANEAFRAAIEKDAHNLRAWMGRAQLFLEKYDYPYAIELFEKALKANAKHAPAYVGLARCHHFNNTSSAMDFCRKALAINPNLAEAHSFLAYLFIEMEDYATALSETETILKQNPKSLDALGLRASAFYMMDKDSEFKSELQKVLAINPHYGELYHRLAAFCGYKTRYQEAADFNRKALELDPSLSAASSGLAINLLRLGEEARGREQLEKAFAQDPFDVQAKNTLDLLDSFSQYRALKTDHFRVKLHEREADVMAAYVPDLLERALATLTKRYGFQPAMPIYFEMYPNHADFAVRTLGLPGIAASGACFGKVVVMDSPHAKDLKNFNWGSTLWHELTHVITMQLTNHRIPRWLSEGLSVYEERRAQVGWGATLNLAFVKALKEGKLLKIREFNNGFVRPQYPGQVPISYYQAGQVCEFIEKKFGFEKIVALLDEYKSKRSTEEAFKRSLGVSLEQFDDLFMKYLNDLTRREQAGVNLTFLENTNVSKLGKAETQAALASDPDNFFALLRLAQIYKDEGATDKAVEWLGKAKAIFPTYAEADNPYRRLTDIYLGTGATDKAIEELDGLRKIEEGNYAVHQQLFELLMKRGAKKRAAEVMASALYINPLDYKLHEALGQIYLEDQRYDDAAREFKAILALNPVDRAKAHMDLGSALLGKGSKADAKREILKALEIAPSYEKAQALLLKIVEE